MRSAINNVQLFHGAKPVVLEEVATVAMSKYVNVKGKVASVGELATISTKNCDEDLT